MRLTGAIVADFAALAAIEPAWLELVSGMASPPPSALPGWSYGLMAQHAADGNFRILTITADGRLVLCFPHYVERRRGRRRIVAACEIAPIISVSPGDTELERLIDLLLALYGRHALHVDHVDTARPEVAQLLAVARRRYRSVELVRTDENVMVDLSGGWEAVRARLSRNAREALRRARSRVRSFGLKDTVEMYDRPDQMASTFAELLQVDALSWKHGRGGAMAKSHNEHVHFAFALARLSDHGQTRIFLQRLDGRPAAFIIAVIVGDRAYFVIWSYVDAFSACSPGRLVMEAALRHLASAGVRSVDFWGRNDAFKRSWSQWVTPRHTLTFHPAPRLPTSLRAGAARCRAALFGPLERHRLKYDDPGPIAKALAPVRNAVDRYRQRAASHRLRTVRSDPDASLPVRCRPLAEVDKLRLPQRSGGPVPDYVFEREDGAIIAAAALTAFRRELHVQSFTPIRESETDLRDCARAVLSTFPQARWIYEPRAELALRNWPGIIAATKAARRE